MLTLMAEEFAPTTSAIGFLEAPIEVVAEALLRWRGQQYSKVRGEWLLEDVRRTIPRLQPLTGGVRPRELLVEGGEWTTYFDCGIQGTDAVSTVGHLTRFLKLQGIAIRSVPDTRGLKVENPGRCGSVQFELFGPLQTEFLNYVRTVSVSHDGRRWRFDATGTIQDFEDVAAYSARNVKDRFNSQALSRYCESLGVRPFDEEFYGRRSFLVTSSAKIPRGGLSLGYKEAQAYQGIVPGLAEKLPG